MEKEYPLLESIQNTEKLKDLSLQSLDLLAEEMRDFIIETVSKTGGHLASNLGAIELTIALHRAFTTPEDKIIWDVGHQCYPHKLLTHRMDRFHTLRQKGGLSGFPKRTESPHDTMDTGHATTSISAGLGVLMGQYLAKTKGNVISVIGDGALTGGMAFEALNHAGHIGKNLIVVLNDNNMSISPNVGAVSYSLGRITATRMYQRFRNKFDSLVKRIPFLGKRLYSLIFRLKKGIKAIFFKENIFSDLGFEYVGPIDGHNIPMLISVFRNVSRIDKPVVIHVSTKKGLGYHHAENNPSLYHGVSPFSIPEGMRTKSGDRKTFTQAFSSAICKAAEKDEKVTAITAAMTSGTGLGEFYQKFQNRFFDVGITEQHAVTYAAGLAATGIKPVVAIYSTFMQRSVDQVIHDVAIPNLPVVFAMDRAGLVPADGETHQGLFDIALFRCVPNLTFLAPATEKEMEMMISYGVNTNGPVMIRYPKDVCALGSQELDAPLESGRGILIRQEEQADRLLISVGGLLDEALEARDILLREHQTKTDIYNLRFIKPIDEKYLEQVLSSYKSVVLIEDGMANGGIGEWMASFVYQKGIKTAFQYIGVSDIFPTHATRKELLQQFGLNGKSVAEFIHSAGRVKTTSHS